MNDENSTSTPCLTGQRILIVEDQFLIAEELAQTFSAAGADVLGPAAQKSKAVDLIAEANHLAAAVLDIDLAGDQEFLVADALTVRGVPFLFYTGLDSSFIPQRYARVPRRTKPCEPTVIVESVLALLKRNAESSAQKVTAGHALDQRQRG